MRHEGFLQPCRMPGVGAFARSSARVRLVCPCIEIPALNRLLVKAGGKIRNIFGEEMVVAAGGRAAEVGDEGCELRCAWWGRSAIPLRKRVLMLAGPTQYAFLVSLESREG
jgi:hypothetical protein